MKSVRIRFLIEIECSRKYEISKIVNSLINFFFFTHIHNNFLRTPLSPRVIYVEDSNTKAMFPGRRPVAC